MTKKSFQKTGKGALLLALPALLLVGCRREVETGILDQGGFPKDETPLKDLTTMPIGVAISYSPTIQNAEYLNTVKRDFSSVTYDYHMKHGAIVQANGSLSFTNADAMLNALGNDIAVYGHTLGWHQNQNASYLKSFAGIVVPAAAELVANGGFEAGSGNTFTNWSVFNTGNPAGTSTISAGAGPNEVRTGSRSMKVVNPVGYPGSQWRVQVASDLVNTEIGKQYTFSYWVKAAAPGGSIRMSSGPNAQYQGDQTIGTAWQQVSWTIVANTAQTRFLFDMGQAANTYYIDDVSVKEVVAAPTGTQVRDKVDEALRSFVVGTVNHFKARVKEWDVVNELFTESGGIRNNANTLGSEPASDVFVWSEYLGRDYALKAFQYAAEADPTGIFYINDFNLESSPAKLDSLISYVNEIRGKGAKVDGIGTQMHISWNTPQGGIETMFKKMAATNLKVKVTELDVLINPTAKTGFVMTQMLESYQAKMYEFVVDAYFRNVPAEQRAGITIWGVNDANSWRFNNGRDFPLMYNDNFTRKLSYYAVSNALKKHRNSQ